MLLRLPMEVLIILLPILIFSLCFHEFSHGYMAYHLGDHTAARNGRLTLNPIAHLDPIGSLMIREFRTSSSHSNFSNIFAYERATTRGVPTIAIRL